MSVKFLTLASDPDFEFSAIWVGALIPNHLFSQFSRDRPIFPNCRKLMLGKALDFNGFRNYCGFRGSGPPASPRSTACSAFFFQWNDNPRPFVWTASVDSIQGEALAMSTNAGTDTTGLHFAAQKKQKAV